LKYQKNSLIRLLLSFLAVLEPFTKDKSEDGEIPLIQVIKNSLKNVSNIFSKLSDMKRILIGKSLCTQTTSKVV